MKKVMIIPGDGVGPEVVSATHKILTRLTDELTFTRFDAGLKYYKEQGYSMSREAIDAAKSCDAVLLGTVMESDERGYVNPEEELIRFLGLTTRIHRVCSIVPGCAKRNIDTYIVTPNEIINPITEMEDVDGITRHVRMQYHNSRIVFEAAAELANRLDRKSITCVNYSNFYKMTGTRFRESFHNILRKRGFALDDMYIEDFIGEGVKGRDFDIITTPLVNSKMVSEFFSSLIGGGRLTAVEDYDRDTAVFRPEHGPLQEIAGSDRVNPIGSLMSGAMMLNHFGMFEEAQRLEKAISLACSEGYMTEDLGGTATRTDFIDAVLKHLK